VGNFLEKIHSNILLGAQGQTGNSQTWRDDHPSAENQLQNNELNY
jgi:hypothetical protein